MESKHTYIESRPTKAVEQLAIELSELDPKPVTYFTPDNLEEVTEDFLSGRQRNPNNATYSALDSIDFGKRESEYKELLTEILSHPGIPQKHHRVYESYVARSIKINSLMRAAVGYRKAKTEDQKAVEQEEFMSLNKELYGETDNQIAAQMAQEVLDDTVTATDESLLNIREEFKHLISKDLSLNTQMPTRLKPSEESKELVGRIVENIYGPLLRHADEVISQLIIEEGATEEDLEIQPQAMAMIFQTIIDKEFSDSGWRVELKSANAINVVNATKTIVVPEERTPASPDKVRGLVVHELGVHMLRSIIGEKSDLIPLRFGLAGVGDAEEGIAKVMESVITKDTTRTGYQHYLTANLLAQGYDFRDTFEIMWRYKVLDAFLDKPESVIDDKFIKKQKKTTFKFMVRSIRGTNELPWHITLNYFKGTNKIWDYIGTHKDDPDLVTLLFMGKIDPTSIDHFKSALDANGRL